MSLPFPKKLSNASSPGKNGHTSWIKTGHGSQEVYKSNFYGQIEKQRWEESERTREEERRWENRKNEKKEDACARKKVPKSRFTLIFQ